MVATVSCVRAEKPVPTSVDACLLHEMIIMCLPERN